jgi:hypothetical protein
MIQCPEFKTAEVLSHEQMSRGISSLDGLLAGGLEVGLTHRFYVGSQINQGLLGFAVQAQLPPSKGGLESPAIIIHSNNVIQIDKLADLSFEVGV